jgi:hypothetical protein
MNVITRNGYAKNGSSDEIGNSSSPQKILAAVIPNKIELATPTRRTQSPGILTIRESVTPLLLRFELVLDALERARIEST